MTLTRLFEETALAHPRQVALLSTAGECTYAELRGRAAALAQVLRGQGVRRERLVGVCIPRSIESMVAVLGVLRAGGAYVPIDPSYPAERQRWMADDARVAAIVIDSRYGAIPTWAANFPTVDLAQIDKSIDAAGNASAATAIDDETTPDDLLYILYTSGSTGRPKGVCGTHSATLNRLRWGWDTLPFGADEVVGHRSSLSFVDAAPEMFSGLLRAVPTAIVLPGEMQDWSLLLAALQRLRVSRLTVVPSILAALLRAQPNLGEALPRLHSWITSGEELSLPLLRAFRSAHPAATLINLYGTTEVTGDVTCAQFPPQGALPTDAVPIGASMAGAELRVRDPQGEAVADGEVGELYVGGPVLARGYHQRPQEDALRFPRQAKEAGARLFRTGDLVRREASGVLWYVGRVDNLVKVRGVRIELEEIERALRAACPGLGDIAVVRTADDQLVAFVTPSDLDPTPLRAAAERILPTVMQPSQYVPLTNLPLLPNGKCDRKTLAARGRQGSRQVPPDQLPATATEKWLAQLWTTLLRRSDIARDDSFTALGGDSLSVAELLLAVENSKQQLPGRIDHRIDLAMARDGTLQQVAAHLDGSAARAETEAERTTTGSAHRADVISLSPLGAEGASDPAIINLFVEASMDGALCANTELPSGMDVARARAYCLASDGVAILVNGIPVGAGLVQQDPNVGVLPAGVTVPAGAVQLDEWLLPRFRGQAILSETGAWPQIAEWLSRRFRYEVSVVWEDHLAMLAILRARGYTRLGRSMWYSAQDGDGTSGPCEVWLYDLLPHRVASEPHPTTA